MPEHLKQVAYNLERIKVLVPDGEDVKQYLAQALETQLSSAADDASMGVVPVSGLSPAKLYASARVAVEYIDQPERLAAKPEGIVDSYC